MRIFRQGTLLCTACIRTMRPPGKVRKQLLRKKVVNVRILYGGLDEWVRRGYAVEPLPPEFNLFDASMARS